MRRKKRSAVNELRQNGRSDDTGTEGRECDMRRRQEPVHFIRRKESGAVHEQRQNRGSDKATEEKRQEA